MRIIDEDNHQELSMVLLMLTPEEANELTNKLSSLSFENGGHLHVDDNDYKREITIAVYTKDNLHFFSPDIQDIIQKED